MTELLLLPGLLATEHLWDYQRPVLESQVNVMIPQYSACDSLELLAETVLAKAPPTFALAGFSMGGYIALEMLRQAPERVQGLALISTTAQADGSVQQEMRRKAIDAVQSGGFERVVNNTARAVLYPQDPGIEEAKLQVIRMAEAVGAEMFCAHSRAIMMRRDNRALLSELSVPSLVAVGAEDQITPVSWSLDMVGMIKNAQLEIIPAAGHALPLQAPAQLTTALERWLERVESGICGEPV